MKSTLKRTLAVLLVFMMAFGCFAGMNVFAESDNIADAGTLFVTDSTVTDSTVTDSTVSDTSDSDTSDSDVSNSDVSGSDTSGSDVSGSDTSGSDVSGSDTPAIDSLTVDSGNKEKDVVACLGGSFEAVVSGSNIYHKIAVFQGETMVGEPVLIGSDKEAVSSVTIKSGTFVLPANNTDKAVEYIIRGYAANTESKDITSKTGEKLAVVSVAAKSDMVAVTPDAVSFSDKGGTADLAIKTNCNVSVAVDNGPWVSLAQATGEDGGVIIKVTASANEGLPRECAVVFSTTGTVPYVVRVKVTQDGVEGADRLSGNDRIATAVAISKAGWEKADTVILASGVNFADALAGAPLSAAADAPILLTMNKTSGVEKAVIDEIARLGAKNVYILGGTAAVCAEIESAVAAGGCAVTRLQGDTRFGTAVAIAKELSKLTGKEFTKLYFANANNYPDALSVSAVAAIEGNPILYMPTVGEVEGVTSKFVSECKCKNGIILGGTAAVSADGQTSLTKLGLTVSRICGEDRYETAVAINEKNKDLFTGKKAALATGDNFPDALAGGALCAKLKIPVVLVSEKYNDDAAAYLKGAAPEGLIVFGGPNAVSDNLVVKMIKSISEKAAK